ncbi:MAG: hypothetical protein R3F60_29770 [bacterium]
MTSGPCPATARTRCTPTSPIPTSTTSTLTCAAPGHHRRRGLRHYRLWFRHHFYQHAGFRLVRDP